MLEIRKFTRGLTIAVMLGMPIHAAECLRVATLGDSHSAVEAGFARSLACAMGVRVEHVARGVVGASARELLRDLEGWQNRFSLASLSAWRPGVILVAFGTNEAKNWRPSQTDGYATTWFRVLTKLQALFPEAQIIVLGPMDANLPGLGPVRTIQESVTASCGIGWVDRVQAMGGEGAMNLWRTARGGRYASRDGIHLTAAGYSELGKRVAMLVADGISCSQNRN